jgi:hypothetical protein
VDLLPFRREIHFRHVSRESRLTAKLLKLEMAQ